MYALLKFQNLCTKKWMKTLSRRSPRFPFLVYRKQGSKILPPGLNHPWFLPVKTRLFKKFNIGSIQLPDLNQGRFKPGGSGFS